MTTEDLPKPIAPPDWREQFEAACANLPETVQLPYEYTPEGRRLKEFKRVCPEQFYCKVDRARLPDPDAFDRVAKWDGSFPGPCAYGSADTAKTLAAWCAMGRLYVKQNLPFAWFPAKRLITEMHEADLTGDIGIFFRRYSHFKVLMIDDVEKVNWDFGSTVELLFAFYDWVYRSHVRCITTSNKGPKWWEDKMGEGMVRRLFKDGHYAVHFTTAQARETNRAKGKT